MKSQWAKPQLYTHTHTPGQPKSDGAGEICSHMKLISTFSPLATDRIDDRAWLPEMVLLLCDSESIVIALFIYPCTRYY